MFAAVPHHSPLRVLVWGENVHEQVEPHVAGLYPEGMHSTIAEGIAENLGEAAHFATTTLAEPEHGLTEEVLAATDVLVWWGHAAHDDVAWAASDRPVRPIPTLLRHDTNDFFNGRSYSGPLEEQPTEQQPTEQDRIEDHPAAEHPTAVDHNRSQLSGDEQTPENQVVGAS